MTNKKGEDVFLSEPKGLELPLKGFAVEDNGYQEPSKDGSNINVVVNSDSERLQLLSPFPEWDGNNIVNAKLLIKAFGKPIVSTSANLSGFKVPLNFNDIKSEIKENVGYVVQLDQFRDCNVSSKILKYNYNNNCFDRLR